VGGVGINLAIQDAVAVANILSRPLASGSLADRDLQKVQDRRELPTRLMQATQALVQHRVLGRALDESRPLRVGPLLRTLRRVPGLRRLPGRVIGLGFGPEHVRRS
jgi:2-polyprenyl-6-methoxyphenol hydroxylase-like FAD-dependent oxidoreductase